MGRTENISPRATLPGTIYKKNGHWWWRVRLPGQDRIRHRSLRPEGSRVGTRNRTQAGQIALRLWEEALTTEAEMGLERARFRDSDPIHAHQAESFPQQPPAGDSTPCGDTSDMRDQENNSQRLASISSQPQDDSASLRSRCSPGHLDWLDSLGGTDDHALCECCGQKDFFEEYLRQIDSGQRLCPRCYGAFMKKAQALDAEHLLCV